MIAPDDIVNYAPLEMAQKGVISTQYPMGPVEELGLRLGGTYGLAVHPSGDRIYIGMNASPSDDDSGFGEVVLLVVDLQ